MTKTHTRIFLIAVLFSLQACDQPATSAKGFQGSYKAVNLPNAELFLDFNSDGTVVVTADSLGWGPPSKGMYKDRGDRVIVDIPIGDNHKTLELVRQGDVFTMPAGKDNPALRFERH